MENAASGSLEIIKKHSGPPDAEFQNAVWELQRNLRESTPPLVTCFIDKSCARNSRLACSAVLQLDASHISSEQREGVLSVLRDEGEHILTRIDAAVLLLQMTPAPSESIRGAIIQMSFEAYKEGTYRDSIILSVFNRLRDDGDVEAFLLDRMRSDPSKMQRDGVLYTLGKNKSQALLGIIRKELDSEDPERLFSKAGMYLALGDVGGSEAADLLLRQLGREKQLNQQNRILRALGVTKAPKARQVLTRCLLEEGSEHRIAVLDGLRYLGDKTVIPLLKEQLKRADLTRYEMDCIMEALAALDEGDDSTHWQSNPSVGHWREALVRGPDIVRRGGR